MTAAAGIPCAPGALPLLGHALPLLRRPLEFLRSLPGLGDLVEVRMGGRRMVVVCDPDLIRRVLRDDRTFDKHGSFYDRARDIAGNGLVTCPHSAHRRQRRLIQPLFQPSRLAGYAEVMAQQATALHGSWQDGQTIDVLAEMSKFTSRVLVATMFGSPFDSPVLSQMRDDLATVVAGLYLRLVLPSPLAALPTPGKLRFDRALARLRHSARAVIAQHPADEIGGGELLSTLLATADGDEPGLSDTEVLDQIITFFLAGVETAATTLSWALHLVATHPEIQQRLQAEVDAVLCGSALMPEDLPMLVLTGRILTETLRLYPPIWFATRLATSDTHLGRYAVPAGTTIVFSSYLIHHRPDLYPEPDRFDPDRWGDQRGPTLRDAFVSFGGGARKCIGETFGLTASSMLLADLAADWQLDPLPDPPVRPPLGAPVSPQGLRLRVSARAHQSGMAPGTISKTTKR